METFNHHLGEVLRKHRVRLSLSQRALADRCDFTQAYMSLLEHGLKSPSMKVILLLAKGLGTTPHQILKETLSQKGEIMKVYSYRTKDQDGCVWTQDFEFPVGKAPEKFTDPERLEWRRVYTPTEEKR